MLSTSYRPRYLSSSNKKQWVAAGLLISATLLFLFLRQTLNTSPAEHTNERSALPSIPTQVGEFNGARVEVLKLKHTLPSSTRAAQTQPENKVYRGMFLQTDMKHRSDSPNRPLHSTFQNPLSSLLIFFFLVLIEDVVAFDSLVFRIREYPLQYP
tara:strand:- start:241 stop:705 length:465 start_codon:yes stop_codon:yes gene_type:complete